MNLLAASLAAALLIGAPASTAATACEVGDAALTWGFKESFRSYISGTIANGEWTVSDGATYETPSFGWSGGAGTVPGTVAFTGSIEFTGHAGILDTTVSDPRLVFDGSRTATLVLDVRGTTQEGLPVDAAAVPFATVDLGDAAGETITEAPVVLTEAGAEAFGTYPAGEQLDPITVSLPGADACLSRPSPLPVVAAVAAGVLVLAAAAAVLVLRRRRNVR
ncbi:hypothetical protein BH09ACT5_BH09ACT5_11040 [soil metagenome]